MGVAMILRRAVFGLLVVGGLSACETPNGTSIGTPSDQLRSVAAPGQDLSTVRIQDDGCYWYEYRGPVETTFLPLRANSGAPICTEASGAG